MLRAMIAKSYKGRIIGKVFDSADKDELQKAVDECENDGVGDLIATSIAPIPEPSYIDFSQPADGSKPLGYVNLTEPATK